MVIGSLNKNVIEIYVGQYMQRVIDLKGTFYYDTQP